MSKHVPSTIISPCTLSITKCLKPVDSLREQLRFFYQRYSKTNLDMKCETNISSASLLN